nr:unnamed protein product [Callosobruchus analis]
MPSKQSREEILKKKREAERARLLRIKSDPIKLAEYKEKERQKYLKKRGEKKKLQTKKASKQTDKTKGCYDFSTKKENKSSAPEI